ncbi:hypothetical protein [Methanocrinis sp.]|uniref:hypothetical protein n=1 Tax=Methanocrinis sp. TaxID=3101522 RepID=UPI003D0BD358
MQLEGISGLARGGAELAEAAVDGRLIPRAFLSASFLKAGAPKIGLNAALSPILRPLVRRRIFGG